MKCSLCQYDPDLPVLSCSALELQLPALSQNQLKGNGTGRGGWLYRRYRDEFLCHLMTELMTSDITQATAKRRVFFERFYSNRCRPFDRDNLVAGMKPLRDCLTIFGLIVDDTDQWLEAHYIQSPTSGNNYITVIIEDIQWSPSTP